MRANFFKSIIFLIIFMGISPFLTADDNTVKVEQLYPGKVDGATFRILQTSDITIYGKGAKLKRRTRDILCYGWIINAETEKMEWSSLKLLKNRYMNDTGIFSFEDRIQLQPGLYKAFYTAVYETDGINIKNFGDLMNTIFSDWDDEDIFTFNEDELNMMVKGRKGKFVQKDEPTDFLPESQKAVVSFYRIGNNASEKKNFSLTKNTKCYIYSAGEKKDRRFYDFGRIYDMQNHEVVWPTQRTIFEFAGGGWKNVKSAEVIELPAGAYSVTYISDDSHAYNEWNVMPPNNPEAWGIQVACDAKDFRNVDFSVEEIKPVVDLTKAGDNALLTSGIELTKDLNIRVICLGEYNHGDVYDYGWIENAATNEIVWKFSGSNTVHAGGGDKNRKFNDIVHLKKGKYLIKYISDGSHSYYEWNTTPPFEKDYWGISLWALNNDDKKYIKEINEFQAEQENIIAKIDRVGDHQKRQCDFTIESDGLYRVYAIGEGDDDEMFDTGWIKNLDNDQVIWELTWRNSQHAGGARKNRMFNGKVYFVRGHYRMYYETDGTHSFSNWNDTPPNNPDKYGIRVMTE